MPKSDANQFKVAVVGATGLVGQQILSVLSDIELPISQLFALASEKSVGKTVNYADREIDVQALEGFDFSQANVAFFAAGGSISEQCVPQATAAGCIVIDNSSVFRNQSDVPLIVPEVNPDALDEFRTRNIIANPNCSTIQMVVALNALHHAFQLEQIVVSTYQSVSGAGQAGIDELMSQSAALLNARPIEQEHTVAARQIAFNVVPQIDQFTDNGFTREEMKMVNETRKIFADDDIVVEPTAVRVPVFIGHAESIYIETAREIDLAQALEVLQATSGVVLAEDPNDYPTPFEMMEGGGEVYVGRVRQALNDPHGLHLWVVADNVAKGAALNAVQILELLVKNGEL